MNSKLVYLSLQLMPKRLYTYMLGVITQTSFSAKVIPWYVRRFQIDENELEQAMYKYPTLGSFFTRKLAAHARPIEKPVISPVDGIVSHVDRLHGDMLLQVKGHTYTLMSLLQDKHASEPFRGGHYVTIYLSPRDYHRIHAPMDCDAVRCDHVPGTLYPVNEHGVHWIKGLFVKNERIVTYFRSRQGSFAMVKVGAAGVGTVCVPYGPEIVHGHRPRGPVQSVRCETHFSLGEELGYFALGSTVILLFPEQFPLRWLISPGDRVCMGQQIAEIPDTFQP